MRMFLHYFFFFFFFGEASFFGAGKSFGLLSFFGPFSAGLSPSSSSFFLVFSLQRMILSSTILRGLA